NLPIRRFIECVYLDAQALVLFPQRLLLGLDFLHRVRLDLELVAQVPAKAREFALEPEVLIKRENQENASQIKAPCKRLNKDVRIHRCLRKTPTMRRSCGNASAGDAGCRIRK